MNAEAVRAWLSARHDEDEQAAYRIRDQRWVVEGDDAASDVAMIAHEDRILREVAAKRRRLERHRPEQVEGIGETWAERTWCHTNQPWPCPDIIDDAQAWADRDDFPAELRLA